MYTLPLRKDAQKSELLFAKNYFSKNEKSLVLFVKSGMFGRFQQNAKTKFRIFANSTLNLLDQARLHYFRIVIRVYYASLPADIKNALHELIYFRHLIFFFRKKHANPIISQKGLDQLSNFSKYIFYGKILSFIFLSITFEGAKIKINKYEVYAGFL